MNHILTINAGSSSFKCALFKQEADSLVLVRALTTKTFEELIALFPSIPAPSSIGHRIVHGANLYKESTLIDSSVVEALSKLTELAPLHNGPSVKAIEACLTHFGTKIPQVAVFDTAFYRAMPEHSRYYAISKELSDTYGIWRFGFHGISHAFLWDTYLSHTKQGTAKVITLHLGAGCSATSIASGRPIDTSMGFTPNEGLVMATRSGDIDPEVVCYLSEKENKSEEEILGLLNFKSGLLGLSGISSDMQTLVSLYDSHKGARFAIDLFCYRIIKYLGAYIAVLGGCDAIIFSAGIGENAPMIRKLIIDQMRWLGLILDDALNGKAVNMSPGAIIKISPQVSKAAVYVIGTDENRQIALETWRLTQKI